MKSARYWYNAVGRLRKQYGGGRPAEGRATAPDGVGVFKVVAATRILDEADIIEAFVRHTASYVDAHVFMDNGSKDGTLAILRSLRDEGFPIVVFQNSSAVFREREFNTFLYREAIKLGASWTLFLDADEFIDDRALEGGLRNYLRTAIETERSLRFFWIALTEYRLTANDWLGELNIARRMKYRRPVSSNCKVVVRCDLGPNISVDVGSHYVLVDGEVQKDIPTLDSVTYAHFPERSVYQFMTKNIRGRGKVLASGSRISSVAINGHYTRPFEVLRDTPDLMFCNPEFMSLHNPVDELVLDPIACRGGDLLYTRELNEGLRAISILLEYLQQLALEHGALLDGSRKARRLVERWSSRIERII